MRTAKTLSIEREWKNYVRRCEGQMEDPFPIVLLTKTSPPILEIDFSPIYSDMERGCIGR